ncbi:hypothetical protein Sango_1249300 [Sesamum angolense]|uniref:Reverse transcriptase zinc-binding domain-containing protein n=1 Tax=Sesamum angolense TaxID=2727404 RepID=A0AAE1WR86_9LAMI|nr:hypothetical protein Sango_1249300 [Sesamum angolense]
MIPRGFIWTYRCDDQRLMMVAGKDERSVADYFASLKSVTDEILIYHSVNCDAKDRHAQWEEFLLAKFLSSLNSTFHATRDTLLSSDSVPTLSNALSQVLCISTHSTVAPPLYETSTLAIQGHGSSRGSSSRGGQSRDSDISHGFRYCEHYGKINDISKKCWIRFGKPEWANALFSEPNVSVPESDQVSLSREADERLIHQPVTNSTSSTITPSLGVFAASHGKRSCTAHPLANSISYDHHSPSFHTFVASLSSTFVLRTYHEVVLHSKWKLAMVNEMPALISCNTWQLLSTPADANVVLCWWVFTLKYRADGSIDWYKVHLVAKGFTQIY